MIWTIWRHMKLLWNARFPIVPTESSLFKFIARLWALHGTSVIENRAPFFLDSHGFPWFPNKIALLGCPDYTSVFSTTPVRWKKSPSGFRSSCSSQCRKKAASSRSASCWTAVGEMGKWLVSSRIRLQFWASYHHYHHYHRYNVTTTTSSIINKILIIYNCIII